MWHILLSLPNRKYIVENMVNGMFELKLRLPGVVDFSDLSSVCKRGLSLSAINCKDSCNKNIARHNYSNECQELVNRQVNMELYAAYWYTSLQHHFDRCDIALPGFSMFFKKSAQEELEHADKFMAFQMKRGGDLKYFPVEPPPCFEWTAAIAIAESIELEKQVTKSIEEIACKSDQCQDHHLNDFVCTEFLIEQYQAIKYLADMLTRIKRAGPGTGLVIIDSELQEQLRKK